MTETPSNQTRQPSTASFFSVIIPTHNRREYLAKAVTSVLEQTCKDFELIIVDDGSTDETEALIAGYSDSRIVYVKQSNHGVAHARNRGLDRARGTFVAFLDSDDWWVPEKLETTKSVIDRCPEIKIFHSEELWYRQGTIHNPRNKHKKPDGFVYAAALPLCCISISTAVVHRDVFETVGVFDESLPACEDYDFWLRATSRFPVKLISEYLTEKEGGRQDQLSSQIGLDRYRIRALAKMLEGGTLNQDNEQATRQELLKKARIYLKGCEKRGKTAEAKHYSEIIAKFSNEPAPRTCIS